LDSIVNKSFELIVKAQTFEFGGRDAVKRIVDSQASKQLGLKKDKSGKYHG